MATLTELRHMVGVLRTSGGPPLDLAPQPRLADITALVAGSGHQARVDLDGAAAGAWPDAVQRVAYRTVQEALTNITKHAPGARVTVQVTPWQRGLRVAVRNGPPPGRPTPGLPGGGHGLIGLRERARATRRHSARATHIRRRVPGGSHLPGRRPRGAHQPPTVITRSCPRPRLGSTSAAPAAGSNRAVIVRTRARPADDRAGHAEPAECQGQRRVCRLRHRASLSAYAPDPCWALQ